MLINPYAALALIVAVVLAAAGGYRAGASREQDRARAEIATLKRGWAEAATRSEVKARQKLEATQALGDALSRDLLSLESTLKQSETRRREIERRTTGRVCLSADAVRLLNSPNHPDARDQLPQAASSTPAADGPAATDRDIAVWADNARRQHDICRARLDALIDFWGRQ